MPKFDHMYRAQIIEQPEFEAYYAFDYGRNRAEDAVEWHRPVGWEPTNEYVERFETNKFFEPSTLKWYKSRSSAADRVSLLESMGYKAIVQQSSPVIWPEDGAAKHNTSDSAKVLAAIRTLVRAGVVKSADELL
ncbi:hypothetical protein [Corynebacterium glyciniphilum]|uniref:hypothetical protein n=1 Tax=Corynebacterium glyciniphilum TaxID=1404244 RepID=UPI002654D3A9|nr:hypothetical protein [Corynebacterium glyciniphilum]MDN6706411.1 hypothetical protein [Corynebacterium glyciniphilum]